MIDRALLLFGAVLVSPAWSQEAPPATPPLTARSFDPTSDSVRRIVHDTAAAQSTLARATEDRPTERDSRGVVRYVPPVKSETAEPPAPSPPSAPPLSPFLAAAIDVLVDEVLHIEKESEHDSWLASRSRDSLESFRQRAQTPDEYPPSPVRPKP